VSRLALALADAGVEVGLWASDQSAASTCLLARRSSVRRLVGTDEQALEGFGKPDILHDNGIWLAHNHRWARLASQQGILRVVSTRGMLEPWALLHKHLKKRVAWQLYQRRDLERALCHHTTAHLEAQNVKRLGLRVPIVTVPNGVELPHEEPSMAKARAEQKCSKQCRTALFLGRIYPIKGLPMLIEAWSRVRPQGWTLQIAGPDEAGHRKEVERAVDAAGLKQVVSFTGPLTERIKEAAFFNAELFVLPSYSESFGMAVAEALAHGLPVLTTSGTPWSAVRENGCGWWVDRTVDCIAEALAEATMLEPESLMQMGAKGRALVAKQFCWPSIGVRFISIYNELIDGRIDAPA
jgi:glycosyltransferase involved in cell wall biosynthesis